MAPTPTPTPSPQAVNGWNAAYLDEQYRLYKASPGAMAPDLRSFFAGFDLAMARLDAAPRAAGAVAAPGRSDTLRAHAGVLGLIDAYRSQGHLAAQLDPFGRPRQRPRPPALDPAAHGLSRADLGQDVGHAAAAAGVPAPEGLTLGALIERLEAAYCGRTGWQFMHLSDPAQRAWFIERVERPGGSVSLGQEDRLEIFDAIVRAEQFEKFLQKRYQSEKRFSIEGGEALIPLLERVLLSASRGGVEEVVLGMPHRGRLTVLNTIMGKTYEQVFTEFEDVAIPGSPDGGGDVKYHRGYSGQRTLRDGRQIHLAMASNPSHLESVGPVVLGRARAKQRLRGDTQTRRRVMPLLLHGDAAVIGQGVVAETLNMSRLEGYTVGGTVHVVVNNMIGFTTVPRDGRSTEYCTDLALGFEVPVVHVNGEDPEAVVAAGEAATGYRQAFGLDAFVDMVCYRKYGHNEQDDPSFTQPVLTELIKAQRGVAASYAERLTATGAITQAELTGRLDRLSQSLERAQQAVRAQPHDPVIEPAGKRWAGMTSQHSLRPVPTGVDRGVLEEIARALGHTPEGVRPVPKVASQLAVRSKVLDKGTVTHAEAELLAFGSLLLEGVAVRLSGQDARRGTFSQRHAVVRDAATDAPYVPLNHLRAVAARPDEAGKPGPDGRPTQARFCVYDSPLSEFAVMGFDYGYSLADPNMLVLWEAQFGDFANGAQTVIDQYIASAEIKWERWSGLVLLLPHGYEHIGPEHSSARLERFLFLCANDNIQVAYPSTGAQHFHLLRRQVKRPFRKPLIVMTPKAMLRLESSRVEELTTGHFQDVLDDPRFAEASREGVRRVILCTGKLYHELAERRQAVGRADTALVRIEQLYPFNLELFQSVVRRYPASARLIWAQEEPRNAGAYLYMDDTLRQLAKIPALEYIGRPASATPAVGSKSASKREAEAIYTAAIGPLHTGKEPQPSTNGVHAPRAAVPS
ncbi:MAG: 2-oxoglutarate dehydrogenase E1 component [Planctomyces sp.]|nr:2-oxoglutarate dehydrogenase E1 component [Planctomyces sp.]